MEDFGQDVKNVFDELLAESNLFSGTDVHESKNYRQSCSSEHHGSGGVNGFDDDDDDIMVIANVTKPESNIKNQFGKRKSPIGCSICEKKYIKAIYYEEHWKQDHVDVHPSRMYNDAVQCKICSRYLQSQKALSCHENIFHREQTADITQNCLLCNNTQCTTCSSTISDASEDVSHRYSRTEAESAQNGPIGCRLCETQIVRPSNYEKHWKHHHPNVHRIEMYENPYKCNVCTRYLPSPKRLKIHMSIAHHPDRCKNDDQQRYCPICGTIVSGFSKLQEHLERFHNGLRVQPTTNNQSNAATDGTNSCSTLTSKVDCKKEFICSNCCLVCRDEKSLESHVISLTCTMNQTVGCKDSDINTRTTPVKKKSSCPLEYVCDICGVKLFSRYNKRRHMFKLHNHTDKEDTDGHKVSRNDIKKVYPSSDETVKASMFYGESKTLPLMPFKMYTLIPGQSSSSSSEKFITDIKKTDHEATSVAVKSVGNKKSVKSGKTNAPAKLAQKKKKTGIHQKSTPISCPVCGSCYSEEKYLRQHFLRQHDNYIL